MTTLFTLLFLIFFGATQAQDTVVADDLAPLLGEWKGSLTYVDYSSNKPYTMPANLTVKQGKSNIQMQNNGSSVMNIRLKDKRIVLLSAGLNRF